MVEKVEKTVFVRPADNPERPGEKLVVRDPDAFYQPIPSEGKRVPLSHYWRRRLLAGDVIETQPPKPKKPKKEEEK